MAELDSTMKICVKCKHFFQPMLHSAFCSIPFGNAECRCPGTAGMDVVTGRSYYPTCRVKRVGGTPCGNYEESEMIYSWWDRFRGRHLQRAVKVAREGEKIWREALVYSQRREEKFQNELKATQDKLATVSQNLYEMSLGFKCQQALLAKKSRKR